ncbi:hypothetical protein J2X72_004411 [Phyllobacterium sp. 1468]|nr:hypothetical protein [Phyllobacterium sp. 1468]
MQNQAKMTQSAAHPHKSGVPSNYALILHVHFPVDSRPAFRRKETEQRPRNGRNHTMNSNIGVPWFSCLEYWRRCLQGWQSFTKSGTRANSNLHIQDLDRSACKAQLSFGWLDRGAQHSRPVLGRRQTSNREPNKLLGVALSCSRSTNLEGDGISSAPCWACVACCRFSDMRLS